MTQMTKKTIATYESDVTLLDPSWDRVVQLRLTEMVIEGKTDGFLTFEDASNTVLKRLWIDQSAAEEWVSFMINTNSQYAIPSRFDITDI